MTAGMIRGLTLTHPWPYMVAHAGKLLENRSWRPESRGGRIGMHLAIHGGVVPGLNTGKREEVRMDLAAALGMMAATGQRVPLSRTQAEWLHMGQSVQGEEAYFLPGIVAIAVLSGVVQFSPSPWAARGQYHWQLADVLTLPEPIPHKGAQGLWQVQPDALEQLRAAWKGRAA